LQERPRRASGTRKADHSFGSGSDRILRTLSRSLLPGFHFQPWPSGRIRPAARSLRRATAVLIPSSSDRTARVTESSAVFGFWGAAVGLVVTFFLAVAISNSSKGSGSYRSRFRSDRPIIGLS